MTKTFYDYWLVLYRRRLLVVLTVATAVAAAWVVSERVPPVYEAVSEFYVTDVVPATSFFGKQGGPVAMELVLPIITRERERSYLGILKSAAIQQRVVEQVPDKSLDRLGKDVTVEARSEHVFRGRARDYDPAIAARVAGAYPKALSDFLRDVAARRLELEIQAKRELLDQTTEAVRRAREKQREFLVSAGTPDVEKEITQRLGRRATLQGELDKAATALESAKRRVAALEGQLRREASAFQSSQAIVGTDTARKLQTAISDLQAELSAARIRYTDKHPTVLGLRSRLAEKQRDLAREVEQLSLSEIKATDSFHEQLRRQLVETTVERATLEAEVTGKARALAEEADRLRALPTSRVAEEAYRAEVARLERMLELLAVSYEDARAQVRTSYEQVVVVRDAEVPDRPKYPIPLLNALIGGVLGLMGGIYLAFFCEYVVEMRARRGP